MPGGPRQLPSGTVTFLFTDIEGSTRLVEQLGQGWPDVLEMHRRALRDAFSRHGGIEKGTEGDSFFVVFAEAPAAIAAAVDAQRALSKQPWPSGAEIRVRVGVHTGLGRVVGGDYVGLDVHRAARIAAAAHGGQVVISETTRALTEHELPKGVDFRDLGRQRLKDLPDEEQLFQLVIPGLPGDFPALRATNRAAGNLPVPLTTFVGREREVKELRELLRSSRLVTLLGPAGTGKTRLVLEAARRAAEEFGDGAWFVGLASVADPGQVPASIATAVGVREVGGKSVQAVLEDHFRPRRCLVVLDNFEHLLAAGPLVTDLLTAAPRLTIAVTSQAELRLSGERLYPVPPLGVGAADDDGLASDAEKLFVERATDANPDLIVTLEAARLIREICARLDGLPLAIELAAARVRLLGIEEILRRLDSRLALLSTGPSDVPDRHRTLRAALAWSHDLLAPPEAVLFRRLAVFSGGGSLAAAERVCVDDAVAAPVTPVGDPLMALDELVRHSLIQADSEAGGTRYRMLETIREFALERLTESGEGPAIRRRHAQWCAELLESLAPLIRLRPSAAGVADAEIDNVQSALEWAADSEVEIGLRICGAAWRVWWRSGRLREGLAWTRRFLALGNGDALIPPRIRALEAAGGIAYWLGENEAAVAAYRERLALAERYGPSREVADAHLDLSYGLANLGEFPAARTEVAAAHSGYEAIGDELGLARCRWVESSSLALERRFREARDASEELLVLFRKHGDVAYASLAMGSLALDSLAMGDLDAADRWFREVLTLGEAAGVTVTISGLGGWSLVLGHLGHPRLAARFQGAYEALSKTYGIQMSPRLREVFVSILAQAGPAEELDPQERQRLMDEGRRLTLGEVLESARRLAQDRDNGWADLESFLARPEVS